MAYGDIMGQAAQTYMGQGGSAMAGIKALQTFMTMYDKKKERGLAADLLSDERSFKTDAAAKLEEGKNFRTALGTSPQASANYLKGKDLLGDGDYKQTAKDFGTERTAIMKRIWGDTSASVISTTDYPELVALYKAQGIPLPEILDRTSSDSYHSKQTLYAVEDLKSGQATNESYNDIAIALSKTNIGVDPNNPNRRARNPIRAYLKSQGYNDSAIEMVLNKLENKEEE